MRIVTTAERARSLGPLPANVSVETDVAFGELRERLAAARVVALPVQDNSYSGATTVLLQAMATARPVVVSRTEAIARGYGLADGENCRLVPPGDAGRPRAGHRRAAWTTGTAPRRWEPGPARRVERSLSWERYADAIHDVLAAAAARHSGG